MKSTCWTPDQEAELKALWAIAREIEIYVQSQSAKPVSSTMGQADPHWSDDLIKDPQYSVVCVS